MRFTIYKDEFLPLLAEVDTNQTSVAISLNLDKTTLNKMLNKLGGFTESHIKQISVHIAECLGTESFDMSGYCYPYYNLGSFFAFEHIDEFISKTKKGDIICVVMSNQYGSDKEFLPPEQILDLINREVEVRIFHPSNDSKSVELLNDLRNQLFEDNSDAVISLFNSYKVRNSGRAFFGHRSIKVLMLSPVNNSDEYVVRWALESIPSYSSHSPDTCQLEWAILHHNYASYFYVQLTRNSDPFSSALFNYYDEIPLPIKEAYHHKRSLVELFDHVPMAQRTNLSNPLTAMNINLMLNKHYDYGNAKKGLNVLVLGCGGGMPLLELESLFPDAQTQYLVNLTYIDPYPQKFQKSNERFLSYFSVFNSFQGTLEDYHSEGQIFDIIISNFSFLVTDLSYLLKVYDLLKENGVALIQSLSWRKNSVSKGSAIADKYLARAADIRRPYHDLRKHIVDDLNKNYSEDIEFYLSRVLQPWSPDVMNAYFGYNAGHEYFRNDLLKKFADVLFHPDIPVVTILGREREDPVEVLEEIVEKDSYFGFSTDLIVINKSDIIQTLSPMAFGKIKGY